MIFIINNSQILQRKIVIVLACWGSLRDSDYLCNFPGQDIYLVGSISMMVMSLTSENCEEICCQYCWSSLTSLMKSTRFCAIKHSQYCCLPRYMSTKSPSQIDYLASIHRRADFSSSSGPLHLPASLSSIGIEASKSIPSILTYYYYYAPSRTYDLESEESSFLGEKNFKIATNNTRHIS